MAGATGRGRGRNVLARERPALRREIEGWREREKEKERERERKREKEREKERERGKKEKERDINREKERERERGRETSSSEAIGRCEEQRHRRPPFHRSASDEGQSLSQI